MSDLAELTSRWVDPIAFAKALWPDVYFYDRQREMIYSVEFNKRTFVKSANMMGKDFTAAFICLKQFLCNPVARIITTSVSDDHLKVLWAEIMRYVQTCRFNLDVSEGGPLLLRDKFIKKKVGGVLEPIGYLWGKVSEKGEGLAGHHAAYTLGVIDEASAMDDEVVEAMGGWTENFFLIGNPNECENEYRRGCDGGDILSPCGTFYFHKNISLKASIDSPNVRRGIALAKLGLPPEEPLIPGVMSYEKYLFRRQMWNPIRQCVGLDAEFYVGAEVKLYPPEWLAVANEFWLKIPNKTRRKAKAIGVDAAEGGDDTAIAVVDEWGIIEIVSKKTPDTAIIMGEVLALARKWSCPMTHVCFDRGGGGKQISDRMRESGYPVSTVAFNEAVNLEIKRVRHQIPDRRELREDKNAYKNRRQEMYGELSDAIDASRIKDENGVLLSESQTVGAVFGIPPGSLGSVYEGLLQEMRPIPRKYDQEGRLAVPPKRKKEKAGPNAEKTLEEIVGHSPDKLDALAIAYWRMTNKPPIQQVGAVS